MHEFNSWWESLLEKEKEKEKRASWLCIILSLSFYIYLLLDTMMHTAFKKLLFMAVLTWDTWDGFDSEPSFPNHFLGSSFSGHLFVFAKALDWSISETTNIPRALIEKPRTQWSVIIDTQLCDYISSTFHQFSLIMN